MVQKINRLLAQSLGTLNAVLAVVFLLLGLTPASRPRPSTDP